MTLRRIIWTLIPLSLGTVVAHADILPPLGLKPGDQFRLAFVSSNTEVAAAGVDSFVSGVADAAGLGGYNGSTVGWHILGSRSNPLPNAIDLLPNSSVPIYDMNGDLVANAAHDIWSGTLLHAINYTETASILNPLVWTATLPDGHVPPTNQGLGDFGDVVVGNSSASDGGWVDFGQAFSQSQHSFYGYSDVISVSTTAPEPSTGLLLLTVIPLLVFGRRSHLNPRISNYLADLACVETSAHEARAMP